MELPEGQSDGSSSSSSSSPEVSGGDDLQQLLTAGGWSPSDVIASVYYVGVDFEYRRQGIGKQLLDLVKKVARGAR